MIYKLVTERVEREGGKEEGRGERTLRIGISLEDMHD